MRFFRLIPLPKLFVACILAFSATLAQARDFGDSWKNELELILDSYIDFWDFITGKPPRLYRFLVEAKTNKEPELELPTPEIAAILAKHTTSPVKESYLGYLKLHNETISTPWRAAINWQKIILRIHYDSKVTGWAIKDSGKSTYKTYKTSDDITDAFCGEETNSCLKGINSNIKETNPSISYKFVTKNATAPTGGYEGCNLAWDSSRKVLSGKWEGRSEKVEPQEQKGNVHIDMHQHRYSDAFDINQNTIDTFSKNTNWNEESIKHLLSSVSKEPISDENLKLIITWYVVQAWNAYEEHLPQYLKNEKNTILNFRVCLKPQWSSPEKNDIAVPMQFQGLDSEAHTFALNISVDTFTLTLNDPSKYSSITSMIAHEILGHGIFFDRKYENIKLNYWNGFIKKQCTKLIKEKGYTNDEDKKIYVETPLKEGLAVAVEYAVYNNSLQNCTTDIISFAKTRYASDKDNVYVNGVKCLKGLGVIKDNGELDFEKLEELNKPANKN